MPYISIERGKLIADQKIELIERLTATASEITHIPEQFFTVTIKELPDENFGIGGKSIDEINKQSGQNLTVEQAKEMMRQFFPDLKRWKK